MRRHCSYLLLILGVLLAVLSKKTNAQTISAKKLKEAEGLFMVSGIPMERDGQGRVVKISLHGNLVRDSVLKLLPQFPYLEALSLQKESFTDTKLAHLQRLPKLKVLALAGSLPARGLEVVGALEGLEELSIGNTEITDSGMARIGALSRLRKLTLREVGIADTGVAPLNSLKNLRELYIESFPLTDDALAGLQGLDRLRILTLHNVIIYDFGFARLSRLKNLRELHVLSPTLSNVHSEGLQELVHLRTLTIEAPLTDAAVRSLAKLPGLEALFLRYTRITDDGLKELGACKKLQDLGITGGLVSDAGLQYVIKHLPRLKGLGLEQLSLTDEGLAHLRKMPRLRQLTLGGDWLTDQGIMHLSALAQLEDLNLDAPNATDPGLEQLANCIGLKHLFVQSPRVSSVCLGKLQQALPNCEILVEELPVK